MQMVNWGIIGCGNVTEIKSGPAFNKVPGSKLVAVMRRNKAKAQDYAARHKVPKWYDDANDLIHDDEVNAIYVATPPSSHEEYVLAAIAAGKQVYVEKPMSTDAASAKRMYEAAETAGVKLVVAHYRRHLPLFKKIKELLHEKIIGNVKLVTLEYQQAFDAAGFAPGPDNWRLVPGISGGGIFHDLAPHQLDLLYYYFGYPTSQHGISINQGNHYSADDVVTAHALFPGNIIFSGNWCFTSAFEKDVCIIEGDTGLLQFSIFKMDTLLIRLAGKEIHMTFETPAHVQQPMIAEVVRYFLDVADNPCGGVDGFRVMQLIDRFTSN